jgi:hypothetical protein
VVCASTGVPSNTKMKITGTRRLILFFIAHSSAQFITSELSIEIRIDFC